MEIENGIIEAPVAAERIKRVYNWMSKIYFLATPLEKKARMRGLELAQIRPRDKVLEVAVGIGHTFLEILKRVAPDNRVQGIDLSPAMLGKTDDLATKYGYTNFALQEADARRLPFSADSFDVLYNSYMMDLLPRADFPVVLGEYYRVLKPGGRLVLVNFSKKDAGPVFYEKLYKLAPYFWGGCRPVRMESLVKQAGFRNVANEIPRNPLPSEIVTGLK